MNAIRCWAVAFKLGELGGDDGKLSSLAVVTANAAKGVDVEAHSKCTVAAFPSKNSRKREVSVE